MSMNDWNDWSARKAHLLLVEKRNCTQAADKWNKWAHSKMVAFRYRARSLAERKPMDEHRAKWLAAAAKMSTRIQTECNQTSGWDWWANRKRIGNELLDATK